MFYKVSAETFQDIRNIIQYEYLNCSFHRNLIREMIMQQFCGNDCFEDKVQTTTPLIYWGQSEHNRNLTCAYVQFNS